MWVSNRHKHREGAAMECYAGLDVSLEAIAVCMVDETARSLQWPPQGNRFRRG
jgi:hypothetical protein